MPVRIIFGEKEWDPNRTERQCAYCSLQLTGSNRTKEDYWPSWLQKKFPHQKGERSAHFTKGMGRSDLEISKGMLGIRQKIRFLCKTCNNEFGSVIQNAAKPTVHQALSRDVVALSVDNLTALAKWATMLTMTWEFSDISTKSISQTTREKFRSTAEIPENFSIWVGGYCGTSFQLSQQHLSRWNIFGSEALIEQRSGEKGWLAWTQQVTTIGLGSLFICVYSYEDLGWSVANMEKPVPYHPKEHLEKPNIQNINPPNAIFEFGKMPCFSDDQLQDLALGFVPPEDWAAFRRKRAEGHLSKDFWRAITTEPDWQ
jgi:hypothetical protein